jgi:glucosyl-3-phosphoglycerate synthase
VAALRTFHRDQFSAAALVEAKGDQRVSVCLPARDEAGTVGPIVAAVRAALVDEVPLVDEILVLDDHSTDATASVAAASGARVVAASDVAPELGDGPGKGQALWKTVLASEGDVIVWCDADVRDFDPAFVTGLLGPLLTEPDLAFVKGYYERPETGGQPGGGRVTELLARPALALLHPVLAGMVQPLSGEYAARRSLVEALPFVEGYGVDIGLLLDAEAAVGVRGLAQVDLGERRHRNRSLAELSVQATEVLHTILDRAGVPDLPDSVVLDRPAEGPARVRTGERPPPRDVAGYRRRSA